MRFGENSRKGASSLIVVMFVAVIALAGTAVYVALDNTVLTKDGHALPGSTITYAYKINGVSVDIDSEIVGYDGKSYYITNFMNEEGIECLDVSADDDIKTESIKVNVPGIGITNGTKYYAENEGATITTVLGGLVYELSSTYLSMIIKSTDIDLGSYHDVKADTLSFKNGSRTATISAISESTNGNYLLCISLDSSTQYSNEAYYIGDLNCIPADYKSGSTYVVDESSGCKLTISNDTITSISMGNVNYTAVTN